MDMFRMLQAVEHESVEVNTDRTQKSINIYVRLRF
jgi:hypothetical protein